MVRVREKTLPSANERVATELNLNLVAPVVEFVRLRYVDHMLFDIITNYVKYYYTETLDGVAHHIRTALRHVPADKSFGCCSCIT